MFRIVNFRKFLGKSCDIQKSCWLDDDYSLEDVGVMCALLDLYITVFEVKSLISREICEQNEDYELQILVLEKCYFDICVT